MLDSNFNVANVEIEALIFIAKKEIKKIVFQMAMHSQI
jgi:hypothetical protein